jgi:predicted DNA-binding protein (MmcQ/YjbR family)
MALRFVEDFRLTRVTKVTLTFPETSRHIYGSHAQFLVQKKTFAYFLNNHHGDGIVGITCKVLPDESKALIEAQSERFYSPAYLASKGWVGLRLDVGKIDWDEVRELLLTSYTLIAPKRLADQVKHVVGG